MADTSQKFSYDPFLFPKKKKKIQLKTYNRRQYQRSVKLVFLLLARFSSFGNIFEQILVKL